MLLSQQQSIDGMDVASAYIEYYTYEYASIIQTSQ